MEVQPEQLHVVNNVVFDPHDNAHPPSTAAPASARHLMRISSTTSNMGDASMTSTVCMAGDEYACELQRTSTTTDFCMQCASCLHCSWLTVASWQLKAAHAFQHYWDGSVKSECWHFSKQLLLYCCLHPQLVVPCGLTNNQ